MSRIVIVSHSHPKITVGGGEIAAHRQFERLRAHGHDAHFVGMTIDPDVSQRLFGERQRLLTFGPNDHCVRGGGMDSFVMEQNDLKDEDWLLTYLLSLEADVYHFHHFWNVGAATIRRLRAARPDARLICTLHEFTAICAHFGQMVKTGTRELCFDANEIDCSGCFPDRAAFDFTVRFRRMHSLLAQFDCLLSPSEFLRDRFIRWGVAPERIHVIENGIDLPTIDELDPDDVLALKSRRFAFFGNATPTKGLDVLVAAAELVMSRLEDEAPGIDVYGCTRERFAELMPERDVPANMRFHGRYRPQDACKLMEKFGWLVIPSTWWENSPVIIQEARSVKTPMIYSDLGGLAEKAGPYGFGFPVGDHFSLAELIVRLNGDVETLRSVKQKITNPLTVDGFLEQWSAVTGIPLNTGELQAVPAAG